MNDEQKRVLLPIHEILRVIALLGEEDRFTILIREQIEPKQKFTYADRDMRCAEWMLPQILKVSPHIAKPNMKQWANSVRLLREQDKFDYDMIRKVFEWAIANDTGRRGDQGFPGWSTLIQSAMSFRAKFRKIVTSMEQSRPAITAPPTVPLYVAEVRQ